MLWQFWLRDDVNQHEFCTPWPRGEIDQITLVAENRFCKQC